MCVCVYKSLTIFPSRGIFPELFSFKLLSSTFLQITYSYKKYAGGVASRILHRKRLNSSRQKLFILNSKSTYKSYYARAADIIYRL